MLDAPAAQKFNQAPVSLVWKKSSEAKMVLKKDHIRLVSLQHLLGGGLSQQSPLQLMLASHLTALHESVDSLPAAAMCISHRRQGIAVFLLLFFWFFELKEAAAVDFFMCPIYSEGSVSHWAELRQRYQCGLNERQGINGAIWSLLRLWGCIIKMTRMRLRMVTSLLPAGYAWCLGRWLQSYNSSERQLLPLSPCEGPSVRLFKKISAESETLQTLNPFNTAARFNPSCIAPLSSPCYISNVHCVCSLTHTIHCTPNCRKATLNKTAQ